MTIGMLTSVPLLLVVDLVAVFMDVFSYVRQTFHDACAEGAAIDIHVCAVVPAADNTRTYTHAHITHTRTHARYTTVNRVP